MVLLKHQSQTRREQLRYLSLRLPLTPQNDAETGREVQNPTDIREMYRFALHFLSCYSELIKASQTRSCIYVLSSWEASLVIQVISSDCQVSLLLYSLDRLMIKHLFTCL